MIFHGPAAGKASLIASHASSAWLPLVQHVCTAGPGMRKAWQDRFASETGTTLTYLLHDQMFDRTPASCGAALDAVESRVVELALVDDLSTLATSRWRRTLARLFGLRPAKPLASARLEALRRYVVLTRHARAARDEVAKLFGLGFTPEQLRAVECRAAAARLGCRRGLAAIG